MTVLITGPQFGTNGLLPISGAKNSVLPIALATLLVSGTTILENVPSTIGDLASVHSILELCGMTVTKRHRTMTITKSNIKQVLLPMTVFKKTRYSALLLSVFLRCFGFAQIYHPGGCSLGCKRPLDIYVDGLSAFGACVDVSTSQMRATLRNERYGTFSLRYPSVVATEGLMLFSVIGNGTRILENSAREPEVQDLAEFLNFCGARIDGAGTNRIVIEGVNELRGVRWELIPDRIEAGTFAILAGILGKQLSLSPVVLQHVGAVLRVLEQMGVYYEYNSRSRLLEVDGRLVRQSLVGVDVTTGPFPEFPTDLQPILTALCLKANGTSRICETVFPTRFSHVSELQKMGAQIETLKNTLFIKRSNHFMFGADVFCHDIRAGAACVLAALMCTGLSRITNVGEILRGYDQFFDKLRLVQISTNNI